MTDNTPEEVAYRLMLEVAKVELRDITGSTVSQGKTRADRAYLLSTYAECLQTVRAAHHEPPKQQR